MKTLTVGKAVIGKSFLRLSHSCILIVNQITGKDDFKMCMPVLYRQTVNVFSRCGYMGRYPPGRSPHIYNIVFSFHSRICIRDMLHKV